jgi:hypothetical protein
MGKEIGNAVVELKLLLLLRTDKRKKRADETEELLMCVCK